MTPYEARRSHSATDAIRWKLHLEEEWLQKEKWEHYAAEIRYHLHLIWMTILSFGGRPDKSLTDKTPNDFFIPFVLGKTGAKRTVPGPTNLESLKNKDPKQRAAELQMTKMVAFAALGLKPDGSASEGRIPVNRKKPSGER